MYKEKQSKIITVLMRFVCLFAMILLLAVPAFAEETGAADSASQDDTQQSEPQMKVIHEKEKIYLISGEVRMLSINTSQVISISSQDPKVCAVNGYGQMFGKKAGTTTVTIQSEYVKQIYTVIVRDTVDLIVFAGQSNMCGAGGDYTQAPLPKAGTAYEFNIATSDDQKIVTMREPFGNGTNRAFMVNGKYMVGNGTLCSCFAIAYYKKTGVPVVGVPAGWGGTTSNTWLSSGILEETLTRLTKAKKYLIKNKCKVRHIYVVWYQGESDGQKGYSGDQFTANMKKIWKKFKKKGCEKMFMIRIAQDLNAIGKWNEIAAAQTSLCKKNKDFILASTVADNMHQSPGQWYADSVHLNQKGLNKVGTAAGKCAGKYAKKASKKSSKKKTS